MNRALMVEQIGRALFQAWAGERRPTKETAVAVLDAILPQVTTAEGLMALPDGTWLMGSIAAGGPVLGQVNTDGVDFDGDQWSFDHALDLDGPLTVIWRPDQSWVRP